MENRFGDFSGKLLVSSFRFDRDWDNWEIHPYGDKGQKPNGQYDQRIRDGRIMLEF